MNDEEVDAHTLAEFCATVVKSGDLTEEECDALWQLALETLRTQDERQEAIEKKFHVKKPEPKLHRNPDVAFGNNSRRI